MGLMVVIFQVKIAKTDSFSSQYHEFAGPNKSVGRNFSMKFKKKAIIPNKPCSYLGRQGKNLKNNEIVLHDYSLFCRTKKNLRKNTVVTDFGYVGRHSSVVKKITKENFFNREVA